MEPKKFQEHIDQLCELTVKASIYHNPRLDKGFYPDSLRLQARGSESKCPDCDQIVRNRVVAYYKKHYVNGTEKWIKNCEICRRKNEVSGPFR